MKEKLMKRVVRIVSGSFNSVVGAIENAVPETVMEETIGEIDDAIDELRVELGQVVANKHLASTRLAEENRRHDDFGEKIEMAMNQGREDLAETAVAQQLDIEAQLPVLETTISDCCAQEKELEGYITALQAKKRQMKDDLLRFRASREQGEAGPSAPDTPSSSDVDRKVRRAESAFERVMERATGIPGKDAETDRKSAVHLAELEEMARKNRIQERLAAIRSRKEKSDA